MFACASVHRATAAPTRHLPIHPDVRTPLRHRVRACMRACAFFGGSCCEWVHACMSCMRATKHLHGCVRACVCGCVCAHTYFCARVRPCVSAPVAMDACTRERMQCSDARASSLVRERACLADIAGQSWCMSLTDIFYAVSCSMLVYCHLLRARARAHTCAHNSPCVSACGEAIAADTDAGHKVQASRKTGARLLSDQSTPQWRMLERGLQRDGRSVPRSPRGTVSAVAERQRTRSRACRRTHAGS